MKRLILMRHAKTEPWNEGIDDHGRAFTPAGHDAATAIGLALIDQGWIPDRAIVSSARRTRETWRHLSAIFTDCKMEIEEGLYLAGERGIRDFISEADDAGTLLVVGHNPGMQDLSMRLIRKAGSQDHRAALRVSSKFPTGSAALFENEDDGHFVQEHLKLQNFLRPKDFMD
ncbi:MAG: histidine phosphatase family protein [Alphaproteobacteria bacterium]|nr:histidine phosphatase family protein [Alphaproteobacteria bacterium]